jgi:hypothetical protein
MLNDFTTAIQGRFRVYRYPKTQESLTESRIKDMKNVNTTKTALLFDYMGVDSSNLTDESLKKYRKRSSFTMI